MTQHQHNCKRCVFLGTHPVQDVGTAELYFCPNGYGGSILSRWGSKPSEYWSMPARVVADVKVDDFFDWFDRTGLQEGFVLARARGLVAESASMRSDAQLEEAESDRGDS